MKDVLARLLFGSDLNLIFFASNIYEILNSRVNTQFELLIKSKILISLLSDDILITYNVTSNNNFIEHAIYYYIFILGLTSYIRPYIRVQYGGIGY